MKTFFFRSFFVEFNGWGRVLKVLQGRSLAVYMAGTAGDGG